MAHGLQWRVGYYPDRILPDPPGPLRAGRFNGGSGITPTELMMYAITSRTRVGFNGGSGITPTEFGICQMVIHLYQCFNGGSGITPTEYHLVQPNPCITVLASMEGRVLPRPNPAFVSSKTRHQWGFNGGSGITPTEYDFRDRAVKRFGPLQWRVGYYPDRIGITLMLKLTGT